MESRRFVSGGEFAYRSVFDFEKLMTRLVWAAVGLLLMASCAMAQQRPEEGGREFQVWTGGGHSVAGGTSNTGVWNLGLRYGWVLTAPHGPGFLKGRFEYAVDAVPAFVVFQPHNTAYGAGVNPLGLKMDFRHTRRRAALSGTEWRDTVHLP